MKKILILYTSVGLGHKVIAENMGFYLSRGGYDVREKEARFDDIVKRLKVQDTAEALVSLGPEQLAIKMYSDALYGNDMYDEFGDYRFDEAILSKI